MSNYIISMIQQKGGVGKTTSVLNIGHYFADILKKKVLLIDSDPQGNLTNSITFDRSSIKATLINVFNDNSDISLAVCKTRSENLDLIPSNIDLAAAELQASEIQSHYVYRDNLAKVRDNYDFIIVDLPPSLGIFTSNALLSSDFILTPLETDFYSLQGVNTLLKLIKDSKKRNPNLNLLGAFATRFDIRNSVCQYSLEQMKKVFDDMLFKTIIRKNTALVDSPINRQSVFEFDKNSNGAKDYTNLSEEIIKRIANLKIEINN